MLNMSEERPRQTNQLNEITDNLQGNSFYVVVYIEVDGKGKKDLVKLKRGEVRYRSNI